MHWNIWKSSHIKRLGVAMHWNILKDLEHWNIWGLIVLKD